MTSVPKPPLKLAVYPKDPTYDPSDAFTVYLLGDGKKECAGTSCALPAKKRFMDAELAAEFEAARCDSMLAQAHGSYWSPLGETWPADTESAISRTMTLLRFATLPHHDEAAA